MKSLKLAMISATILFGATLAQAQNVEFGDDKGEYSDDGECDDRRFVGFGMASSLDIDDNYHDATDCRTLFNAGLIQLVSDEAGQAATDCDAIVFGKDTSEWKEDGECDDPRFDGPGVDSIISMDDLLKDATDCRDMCQAGKAWLRTPAN